MGQVISVEDKGVCRHFRWRPYIWKAREKERLSVHTTTSKGCETETIGDKRKMRLEMLKSRTRQNAGRTSLFKPQLGIQEMQVNISGQGKNGTKWRGVYGA